MLVLLHRHHTTNSINDDIQHTEDQLNIILEKLSEAEQKVIVDALKHQHYCGGQEMLDQVEEDDYE